MRTMMICCGVLTLLGCSSSQPAGQAPTSQPADAATAKVLARYKDSFQMMSAGAGDRVPAYYVNDALYVNASGGSFEGVDAIAGFVHAASKADVKQMVFDQLSAHEVKAGVYVHSTFRFSMQLPNQPNRLTIAGERLSLWHKDSQGVWKMRVDVWLPNKPATDTDVATLKSAHDPVAQAWRAGDYKQLATLYSPKATVVMSDGSVRRGQQEVNAFLTLSQKFKVANYTSTAKKTIPLSAQRFFGHTTYAFDMTIQPGKTMTLQGCRVILWQRVETRWQMVLDFALPSKASMCQDA